MSLIISIAICFVGIIAISLIIAIALNYYKKHKNKDTTFVNASYQSNVEGNIIDDDKEEKIEYESDTFQQSPEHCITNKKQTKLNSIVADRFYDIIQEPLSYTFSTYNSVLYNIVKIPTICLFVIPYFVCATIFSICLGLYWFLQCIAIRTIFLKYLLYLIIAVWDTITWVVICCAYYCWALCSLADFMQYEKDTSGHQVGEFYPFVLIFKIFNFQVR